MKKKKSTYTGLTEARKRANQKYIDKFAEVKVRMTADKYANLSKAFFHIYYEVVLYQNAVLHIEKNTRYYNLSFCFSIHRKFLSLKFAPKLMLGCIVSNCGTQATSCASSRTVSSIVGIAVFSLR